MSVAFGAGRGARCTEEACQNHKQVADDKDNGQDCHSWLSTRLAGQLLTLNRRDGTSSHDIESHST